MSGSSKRAARRAAGARILSQLRGAFALGFIFAGDDNLLIGARNGPPLAIGYGDGEMYLGSDAIALGPFTDIKNGAGAGGRGEAGMGLKSLKLTSKEFAGSTGQITLQ